MNNFVEKEKRQKKWIVSFVSFWKRRRRWNGRHFFIRQHTTKTGTGGWEEKKKKRDAVWGWKKGRNEEAQAERRGARTGSKLRPFPPALHTLPLLVFVALSLHVYVCVCVLKRAICPSYTHTTHEAAAMLVSRSPSSSLRSRSVTRNVTSNRPVANVQTGTIRWDAHPLLDFLGCVSRHW